MSEKSFAHKYLELELGPCTCGHEYDEHGGDPDFPGSSACNAEDCDCGSYDEE